MPKTKIVAAQDLTRGSWLVNSPVPHLIVSDPSGKNSQWSHMENTKIEAMIRVGNYVDVFARYTAGPKAGKGIHQILMPPTIMLVTAMASRDDWSEILADFEDDVEMLDEVIDISGNIWRLNEPYPDDATATITAMVQGYDDTIDVFVLPNPGTDLDKHGVAIIATLMPLTVQRVASTNLSLQKYQRLIQEALEDAEEEEETPPEDEVAQLPLVAAATAPHGIGASILQVPQAPPPPNGSAKADT